MKSLKPKNLIQHGKSHYIPIQIKNYTELAQMQQGLLLVLQQLRDVNTKNQSNEGIYWIAKILQNTIHSDNYEILDTLNSQKDE